MATIKSHTDLQQSKVLATILPLESADYFHAPDVGIVVAEPYKLNEDDETVITAYKGAIPCWSLAALLSVLPKNIPHKDAKYVEDRKYWTYSWILTSNCLFYRCTILLDYGGRYDDVFAEVYHQDNPVDACYEMILKLHELNLL